MSDLYLIAHKVRGEPAFDIAKRLQIGDEEGWIIPTSGHRAYPYWHFPLQSYDKDCILVRAFGDDSICQMPADIPDHYACNDRPSRFASTEPRLDLLALIGKPKVPIDFKRRV